MIDAGFDRAQRDHISAGDDRLGGWKPLRLPDRVDTVTLPGNLPPGDGWLGVPGDENDAVTGAHGAICTLRPADGRGRRDAAGAAPPSAPRGEAKRSRPTPASRAWRAPARFKLSRPVAARTTPSAPPAA